MNLFDIVSYNYFSLFAGKNKSIYMESLMVLFKMLENDETFIKKNDFLKALKEKAENLNAFSFQDEEVDGKDDLLIRETIGAKASFIIKRLEETGWLDIAIDPETFEETIVLPPYSIAILKAFFDVISDSESPYLSLVHSTYSELKLEDEEQDDLMFATLLRSYENTKKLKVELITLMHSIRIFQNRLGKKFQTNEVLHDFFDIYKKQISDRYYHPLKTFDSVSKFKRPIIRILEKWIKDKDIRAKLVMQASFSYRNNDRNEIENDVITKINYISDTYESLNSIISSIDKENSLYTKASANKILYLNNTDKTIKGHLENIFKYYAKNTHDPYSLAKVLSKMQESLYFYEQGFIDSESLTLPLLRRLKEHSLPLEIVNFDEANEFIMEHFLEETKNIYTDERIYQFMENAFGDSNELKSADIPLLNTDSFICLIMATIKRSDPLCFYVIEEKEKKYIKNHEYLIPDFLFKRKEHFNEGDE